MRGKTLLCDLYVLCCATAISCSSGQSSSDSPQPAPPVEVEEVAAIEADDNIVSLSAPTVQDSLPTAIIRQVVVRGKPGLAQCISLRASRGERPKKLTMNLVVEASGQVRSAKVTPTGDDPALEACLSSRVASWRFPPPAAGGIVEINLPFVFDYTSEDARR